MEQFIFLGGMILVMYLFFIRPQTKRQQDQRKFQQGLSKGQRIVTNGGIHGKIVSVDENSTSVMLEVGSNKMKIERSAISHELTKLAYEATGGKGNTL